MTPLLDAAYLRELAALRRQLSFRAASRGGPGEHTASARGASAEFREHRAYAPGDDLRRVDWLAFARTGQPVTKTFRAEEDVVVRIVLDGSASMGLGSPSKASHGASLAAGIAYLALEGGERAQSFTRREGQVGPGAAGRGRGGFGRIARSVAERIAGHDVRLLQVLAPEDLAPSLEGDLRLEDCESGVSVELTLDGPTRAAYHRHLVALCNTLATAARRAGGSYTRTTPTEPRGAALRRVAGRLVDAPP